MLRHIDDDPPEVKAFDRSAATLEAGLNPDDVTNALYSAGIITRIDREKITSKGSRFEKVEVVISAVGSHLATNPDDFQKLVEIINREPSFSALVAKLNDEYKKAKIEHEKAQTKAQQKSAMRPEQGVAPQQASSSSYGQGQQYRPSGQDYPPSWSMQPGGSYYRYPLPQQQTMYPRQPYPRDSGRPVLEPGRYDNMVDNRPLSIKDLIDVLEALEDVAKWYELGLALGLLAPALDVIKEENPTSVRNCKREMLGKWLKKSTADCPSSWRELVKALRRKLVAANEVADSIVTDHRATELPSQEKVTGEHHQMQSAKVDPPLSSWSMPSYLPPPETVSSGYSQPRYNPRPYPQFGADPMQPLHGNFHPVAYAAGPSPSLSGNPSAPWSHVSSYPSFPLHEEQPQVQPVRVKSEFDPQFEQPQIATSNDSKKVLQLIFSKHQPKIIAAVQTDLVRFAHVMESDGIINQRVAQDAQHGIGGKGLYELAAHVLSAVRSKVENYPYYFPKFVQSLESFDSDLSRDLMIHYHSQLAGWS